MNPDDVVNSDVEDFKNDVIDISEKKNAVGKVAVTVAVVGVGAYILYKVLKK